MKHSDYLIVHKKILPDYLEKVIETRELLASREAATVTEAVQRAGISRNTYYKYKDYVFAPDEGQISHRAVISMILKDVSGSLSAVMHVFSEYGTSILTISQAVPIGGKANVMISADITNLSCTMEEFLASVRAVPSVRSVHLDAMD
ncbi:MAG: ACT domain-containing protein [Lachnospiraceae bacterium]|nr:ACT domain-containing protein [Lachnospiraceae bacterium]